MIIQSMLVISRLQLSNILIGKQLGDGLTFESLDSLNDRDNKIGYNDQPEKGLTR